MYLVFPCAHGIWKNEFRSLKIGGGQKTTKPIPYTHTCVWQSTLFEVFVSILEVLEKYSCRILRSIRPYTSEYTAVYSEEYGRILRVYGDFLPPTHATILMNYPPPPPPLQVLMTLQPPNTLCTQKSTI